MSRASIIVLISFALSIGFADAQDITFVQTGGPYGGSANVVASPDGTLFVTDSFRWYRTADDGTTWQSLPPHLSAIWASADSTVYAGGTDGAFTSDDSGVSWTRVGFAGERVWQLLSDSSGVLWSLTDSVRRSDDRGLSWISSHDGTRTDPSSCPVARILSDGHGAVYLSTQACGPFGYGADLLSWSRDSTKWVIGGPSSTGAADIARSADGALWVAERASYYLNTGTLFRESAGGIEHTSGEYLAVLPLDDNSSLVGTPSGLAWSIDGASATPTANVEYPVFSLSRTSEGILYAGTSTWCQQVLDPPSNCEAGYGVFRRGPADTSWTRVVFPYGFGEVITLEPSTSGIWAATENGLYFKSEPGADWSEFAVGPHGFLFDETTRNPFDSFNASKSHLVEARSGDLFAATTLRGLYRYSTKAQTWTLLNVHVPYLVGDVALVESDGTLLFSNTETVLRSDDRGETWETVLEEYIDDLVTCDSLILGAGYDGIWSSSDAGRSWSEVQGAPQTGYLLEHTPDGRLMLLARPRLFASDDCGSTWTELSEHPGLTSLAVDTDRNIFGKVLNVVVASWDGGVSWDTLDTSAITGNITAIALDKYNYLYLGTDRSGVWRSRERTAVGVDDEQPTQPAASVDVYPNPFSEQATIRLSTEQPDHVRVEVFDMLGRLVYVVADGDLPRGLHEIRINGQPLASGLYLVRVTMGRDVLSRKLVRR
ncbi:MAG: T9SS type A sorting domain-containing protein [Rhodothermales bacterium]